MSVLGRAAAAGALDVRVHDLREGADDARRSVDDSPFGGGAGMVLSPEPIFRACRGGARSAPPALPPRPRRPAVRSGTWPTELASTAPAASPCCADATRGSTSGWPTTWWTANCPSGISCWPGGELAALVVVEAVARLLPDVLGNEESAREESFTEGLLEYPQYTRPAEFRGWAGPRGAPVGGPRGGGRLAPLPGAPADGRTPAGSDCAPGQGLGAQCQRRAGPVGARLRCSVRH